MKINRPKKLFIGIPVYISNDLHLDFTRQTVESVKTKHDAELFLIENYCKPEFEKPLREIAEVVQNPSGNSVVISWNLAIDMGVYRKVDYILIPNNDIIFHPKCIDNLIAFAEEHPEYVMWTAAEHTDLRTLNKIKIGESYDEHPHFSCFMVSPQSIERLKHKEMDTGEPKPGYFDEAYTPAYFEDGDMHNRLIRAKFKAAKTASAIFYHFGSRTIKTDPLLDRKNRDTYEKNREYFVKKWGWDPHGTVVANDDPIRFEYKAPFIEK